MPLPAIAAMIGSSLLQLAQQRQQQEQQDQENENKQQSVGLRDVADAQAQAPGSAPGSIQAGAGNGLTAVGRLTNAPAAQAEADRAQRQLGATENLIGSGTGLLRAAAGAPRIGGKLKSLFGGFAGGAKTTPASGPRESIMG